MSAVQLTWNHFIIRNLRLIISRKRFKRVVNFFYEKHFSKDNIDLIEYYSNFRKDSYLETERTLYFTINRTYSSKAILFHTVVIYKNRTGNPYAIG